MTRSLFVWMTARRSLHRVILFHGPQERPGAAGQPSTEILPATPPAFRNTLPAFTASAYPPGAPRAPKGDPVDHS